MYRAIFGHSSRIQRPSRASHGRAAGKRSPIGLNSRRPLGAACPEAPQANGGALGLVHRPVGLIQCTSLPTRIEVPDPVRGFDNDAHQHLRHPSPTWVERIKPIRLPISPNLLRPMCS